MVTAINDTTAISGNRFAIQNGDFAVLVAGSLPSGIEVGDSVEIIGQPLLMGGKTATIAITSMWERISMAPTFPSSTR